MWCNHFAIKHIRILTMNKNDIWLTHGRILIQKIYEIMALRCIYPNQFTAFHLACTDDVTMDISCRVDIFGPEVSQTQKYTGVTSLKAFSAKCCGINVWEFLSEITMFIVSIHKLDWAYFAEHTHGLLLLTDVANNFVTISSSESQRNSLIICRCCC